MSQQAKKKKHQKLTLLLKSGEMSFIYSVHNEYDSSSIWCPPDKLLDASP